MPEEFASKASTWGGAISVWLKIGGTIIVIIGYGFLTYYQIQSNTADQHEFKLLVEKEFEVWKSRSDKRYKRAMTKADDFEKELHAVEAKLEDTRIDQAFIKGRMYEQDKNR